MRLPFFRASRGVWYVWSNGRQVNLGPDRTAAFEQYALLLKNPPPKLAPDSVAALMDLFLDWVKLHRAKRSYEWYTVRCQSFLDSNPALTLAEIKPFHVQQWADSKDWNDGMSGAKQVRRDKCANGFRVQNKTRTASLIRSAICASATTEMSRIQLL